MSSYRPKGAKCAVTVQASLSVSGGRPVGWVGGVTFHPDEPISDVMTALDSTLAQVRVQMEQEIREACR